ncbi:MAG: PA14 domain-containing protein [Planctomycetota bacterium]
MTGEPLTYKGWAPDEPNNWGGAVENWAALYPAQWCDVPAKLTGIASFICEWEPGAAGAGAARPAGVPVDAVEFGGHFYKVMKKPGGGQMFQRDAARFCAAAGGRLATISTAEENEFLAKLVAKSGAREAWIGMTRPDADAPWGWESGEKVTFKRLAPDAKAKQVLLRADGKWQAFPWNKAYFVCEWAPPAARPANVPADAVEFGGRHYKAYRGRISWNKALARCKAAGGYLPCITSAAENAFIARLASGDKGRVVCLGASDEEEEGRWRWVSGESFEFKSWAPTEPNGKRRQNRLGMWSDGSGGWVDIDPEHKLIGGYVCEWGPGAARAASTRAAAAPAALPATAPAGSVKKTGLLGTYFNGTDLETPAMRRVDAKLVLDFGSESPFPGRVGKDFSVRWEGSVTPPRTGEYVFNITSDDGARLWVGERSLIDKWGAGTIRARSEPIALERGKAYLFKLEYRDVAANALITLAWSGPGIQEQPIPEACFAPPKGYERSPGPPIYDLMLAAKTAAGAKPVPRIVKTHGLLGYYYEGMKFEELVARRLDAKLDFSRTGLAWPEALPKQRFSAKWEGYIAPPKTGDYLFSATSDDGCRLSVAGVSVLDRWIPGSKPVVALEPVRLERGKMYPILVEFFDVGGQAYITVYCSGPGFEKQVVPSEWLIPAKPKGGALPPSASERTAGDWSVPKWANPARLSLTKSRGADVLTVEVPAGGKEDKAAAGTASPPSLAGKRALQLTARNSGRTKVSIALGFLTSGGYFETKPVALPPGKAARVVVDLTARDFKCKATKWLHESTLRGAASTREFFLLIYNGGQEASVAFAGLRAD